MRKENAVLHTMKFYPAVKKKNEITKFAGEWMERENIMLNEATQT